MDRETWEMLLGRPREALVQRSRDPEVFLRADWDEREILIQDDREDPSRWMTFDMESEYEDQAPRHLTPGMVDAALGPK